MVRDVLDLVRDRPAVDLAQLRQDVGEGLALDADAKHGRRNQLLELRRQLRDEELRLERRVADRLGAERVEVRRQVAVRPVGLDQGDGGRDALEKRLVGLGPDGRLGRRRRGRGLGRRLGLGRRRRRRLHLDLGGRRRGAVFLLQRLEQAGQARERLDERGIPALEERSPLLGDRLGVLQVLLEQRLGIAHVQSVDISHAHQVRSSTPGPSEAASSEALPSVS